MSTSDIYFVAPNRERVRHREKYPPDWLECLVDDTGAARYFKTTPRHIRHLRETGRITFIRVGRFPRFRLGDLEAFAAANLIEAIR